MAGSGTGLALVGSALAGMCGAALLCFKKKKKADGVSTRSGAAAAAEREVSKAAGNVDQTEKTQGLGSEAPTLQPEGKTGKAGKKLKREALHKINQLNFAPTRLIVPGEQSSPDWMK